MSEQQIGSCYTDASHVNKKNKTWNVADVCAEKKASFFFTHIVVHELISKAHLSIASFHQWKRRPS